MGKDENNLNLHFNPRFKYFGDVKKLVFNSKKAGAWETELRDSVFPLQPGSVIEVGWGVGQGARWVGAELGLASRGLGPLCPFLPAISPPSLAHCVNAFPTSSASPT